MLSWQMMGLSELTWVIVIPRLNPVMITVTSLTFRLLNCFCNYIESVYY